MATPDSGPFRRKSIERLSSPERLDQLLRVAEPRSWLPLATLGGLLFVVLAWAVFGKVPVNVEGKGILIGPSGVVELQSPGTGYLRAWNVSTDTEVSPGDVIGLIDRPDLEQRLRLQQDKLRQLTALGQASKILGQQGLGLDVPETELDGDRLARYIEDSRSVAENLRRRGLQLLAQDRETLGSQLELAREQLELAAEQLAAQKGLRDEEIASEREVLAAGEAHMDARARVADLEARIRALDTRQLEIEDQYFNRLQRIADLRLDMEGYEQQIQEVTREIERLELTLAREGRIVSEHAGRVLELSVDAGRFLKPGDRLGSIAVGDADAPLRSLTYFTVRDGKRLHRNGTIRVTPDTVDRQRYGSIEGRVLSVSPFPVTLDKVASTIGNRGLAEALISGGYRMEVLAELIADPATDSRLKWISSQGPPMRFSAGTTTTARIAVDEQRPISFVLPFFKKTTGIE